jgi:hypothetical protein
MDNLRTHKIDGVRHAVEAVGAKVRYLPAYSPDLDPIEMAFSKLKTALRKGAARTVTTLMKLIGKLIKTFAPEQCANYFRYAGYAQCPISSGNRSSVGHQPSLRMPLTSPTCHCSPAGIMRTLLLSPALTRAWELTASSMRTSFKSVSGCQFSVTSRSPGKICHLDPSSSSTR